MILILTDEFDRHAEIVIQKLKKLNADFFRMDLNVEALKYTYISFLDGRWKISCRNGCISQEEISCVWVRRPFVELTLEEKDAQDANFKIWKNEWNDTLLGLYNSLKTLPWLNPLRRAYKGENKYYQMELASEIGFLIPKTLVSNSRQDILSFVGKQNRSLFKLMSQDLYWENGEYKGFYTNLISLEDLKEFHDFGENPLVFQEYVEKLYEVRYTVVGNQHLVCKIDSQQSDRAKEDWRRYDIPHTPHSIIEPPEHIKEKVDQMMDALGLEYGALDFIVTPNNEWVFLEINCFGQWLWIEQLSGLPISDSIANWLINKKEIRRNCK